MSAIDQLEEVMTSEKRWARERAEVAKAIHQQYTKGNLSDSEYKELLEDIIRTDRLDQDADDVELRSNLVSGINGLLKVIG